MQFCRVSSFLVPGALTTRVAIQYFSIHLYLSLQIAICIQVISDVYKSIFCIQCFSITPPPESSFKFNLDWSGSFLTFHSSVWIEFRLNLIFWHNLKQIISFVIIICVPCWCRDGFLFLKNEIDNCTADIVSIKLWSVCLKVFSKEILK